MKLSLKHDILIAGLLSLVGLLTRVPYLALIPVFEDEVLQTVYALSIRPGDFMPLVGDDPYTGSLFSYILAVCLRLFGSTPVAPRIVVMVMGALTVGLTYLLARALGLGRPWAALAGLLMAANPHHILISSHYAGATYALPFFSTVFLLALAGGASQVLAGCHGHCWGWRCKPILCWRSCCRARRCGF
jgi:predicted membrane-bound mannosyltransferase